jgi:hypothetical protein
VAINPGGNAFAKTLALQFFQDTGNIVQVPGVTNPSFLTSGFTIFSFIGQASGVTYYGIYSETTALIFPEDSTNPAPDGDLLPNGIIKGLYVYYDSLEGELTVNNTSDGGITWT